MSERLSDEVLEDLHAVCRFGHLALALDELLERRAAEQATLRDEIAMRVLPALVASTNLSNDIIEADARVAYCYADAMLAERAKAKEAAP